MFSSKRLVVVVLLVAVLGAALPSCGASFKNKTISDQQFLDMCRDGDTQEVINAINSGADVNAKEMNYQTALILAAMNGHAETVNALIDAGAYVKAKDNPWGKMAVDYARDTLRGTDALKCLEKLSK